MPDYRGTPGNLGAWCMHRNERAVVIVTMLTFWTDLDAIRRFAGSPEDTAKYYDFDSQFLVEMPDRVQHYSVAEA